MAGVIERTNDRESPMLVWVAPFGVPVYVDQNQTLRFEFDCSETDVLSDEFGNCLCLTFPPECRPRVTLQRPPKVGAVDLPSPDSLSTKNASSAEPQFQGLIAYLEQSIKTTSDCRVGEDFAEALNKIGDIAAIKALFNAYYDVQECLAESLQPRIIYWLNLCEFDTPEKRGAGLQHLEFLRGLIAQSPDNIAPESCRRAFYLMSKMQEDSPETIELLISLIERIACPANHEWKVTRDAAILFVEKRVNWRVLYQKELRDSLAESLNSETGFDPALCCPACDRYRGRRAQTGEVCPVCKFDFVEPLSEHQYCKPRRRR